MKKNYVFIILIVFIIGLTIGILAKDYNNQESTYVNKDKIIKKEIKSLKKNIKSQNKEKHKLEKEVENITLSNKDSKLNQKLDSLKEELGYADIDGEGFEINIDAADSETGNIANIIDYNKILLNIVNDLKVNGAKFISINNQRINQYSEITLAGNHININSTPIAQPYNIRVVGDINKLKSYINKNNTYIDSICENYPLKVETKLEDNITIEKMSIVNKLNYIEGE